MKALIFSALLTLNPQHIYAAPKPLQMIQAQLEKSSRPHFKDPIVIAIIDTGLDSGSHELQKLLWENPGEAGLDDKGRPKSSNGLDDDGNGYIDDVHGWDFARDANTTQDVHGHGTHITGIIDQVVRQSNSLSIPIRYMILKYYDTNLAAHSTLHGTIRAFEYAVRNGAHIINFSGGGQQADPKEKEVLLRAESAGVLVVAAAGNDGLNTDRTGYFPANYPLSNIISVGGVSANMQRVPSSNFGSSSVTLSAPGENIRSTLPQDKIGLMTGTSQATAFVTGVAALTLLYRPDLKQPKNLIEHLVQTSIPALSLKGASKSEAVISLKRALSIASEGELVDGSKISNYSTFVEEAILSLSTPDEDMNVRP